MGTIKDKNGMDLTEAEDIKKRWQEYTELYILFNLKYFCALNSRKNDFLYILVIYPLFT